jgi:DNA-binding transcriptional MerR regulator
MPKPTKKQIESMRKLGFTDEEIEDVIKADDAIDHGEKVDFDLDPEKEKEAKKYIKSGTRKAPVNYQLDNTGGKRSRKENPTKNAIIAEIAKFLEEISENACENVVITNKERQIAFTIGENSYELTLVQKRKPKE